MKTIAIVFCLLVAGVCFADDFTVRIAMLIDEETDVELAESLIRRELRSLGDVEIVDNTVAASWYLDIAIIESSNSHIGFLSVWFRHAEVSDLVDRLAAGEFEDDTDMTSAAYRHAYSFEPWNTSMSIRLELRDLVEGLILRFDQTLDKFRPGGSWYREEGQ